MPTESLLILDTYMSYPLPENPMVYILIPSTISLSVLW